MNTSKSNNVALGCINCGYTTNDEMEFRFHPCHRNAYSMQRAEMEEAKAEALLDKVSDEILKIIGETLEESLTSPRFNQLRNLFAEFERVDELVGKASEKILSIQDR